MILKDTPTQTSNQPQMIPFNSFVRYENRIDPAPSPHSPPRKEGPSLPNSALSSGTQRTQGLRVKETIPNMKELVKKLRKLIKTKQTPRFAGDDDNRGSGDNLDPFTSTGWGRILWTYGRLLPMKNEQRRFGFLRNIQNWLTWRSTTT